MHDDQSEARPPKRRLWLNWPLALGLIFNFGVWIAAAVWFLHRRR